MEGDSSLQGALKAGGQDPEAVTARATEEACPAATGAAAPEAGAGGNGAEEGTPLGKANRKRPREESTRTGGAQQAPSKASKGSSTQPAIHDRESRVHKVKSQGSYGGEMMEQLSEAERERVEAAMARTYPEVTLKRHALFLLGYLGSGFSGMQINPGVHTVEAELEKAVFLAGLMHPLNFGFPAKVSFSRAARTDKGVHAGAQVCSMKVSFEALPATTAALDARDKASAAKGGSGRAKTAAVKAAARAATKAEAAQYEVLVGEVNKYLPDSVRVFSMSSVGKKFNSKTLCSGRRYVYLLPTFLFMPPEEAKEVFQRARSSQLGEQSEADAAATAAAAAAAAAPAVALDSVEGSSPPQPSVMERASLELGKYRLSPERLAALQDVLAMFCGTKSYHNYTPRMDSSDASAKRYITKFAAGEPFLAPSDPDAGEPAQPQMEWIHLSVSGQSFILNQIRMMVGMTVEVVSGRVTSDDFNKSFSDAAVRVSVAPPTGLYLDMVLFDWYNKQADKHKAEWSPAAEQAREAFVEGKIRPHIIKQEALHQPFATWLEALPCHAGKKDAHK